MAKKQMVLFIIASAADLAVTLWGTALTGYGAELNPIARAILVTGGPLGLGVFKLTGVVVVLVLTARLARDSRAGFRLMAKLLFLLGALMAGAGAWCWLPVLSSIYL